MSWEKGIKDSGIQRVRLILEPSILSIIANVFGDDFFIRYSGILVKLWEKSGQWGVSIGFFDEFKISFFILTEQPTRSYRQIYNNSLI